MSHSAPNSRASSPSPTRHGGARIGSGRNSRVKRSRVNNAEIGQAAALMSFQHRQRLAECISSLSNSQGHPDHVTLGTVDGEREEYIAESNSISQLIAQILLHLFIIE